MLIRDLPQGCHTVEIRINKHTESKLLQDRISGSQSLPNLKTILAIIPVQPKIKDIVSADYLQDSFRMNPTANILNKIEIKAGP